MAFTDNSDLYGAVTEEGMNLVIGHIMRQRPSLFNYSTSFVASTPGLLCTPVDVGPAVTQRNNPIITVEEPLPVLGTSPEVGFNYCFQITKAQIDLHPGDIALPAELTPPLAEQHFAVHAQMCAGLGCPAKDKLDIPPDPHGRGVVLPTNQLECFCLDFFVVGHV